MTDETPFQVFDRPSGAVVRLYDQVASTNAVALAAMTDPAANGTWFVAKKQTAGRGRAGRSWSAPEGNLYASYAVAIEAADEVRRFPIIAGCAMAEAVDAVVPMDRYDWFDTVRKVKWPNDLLVDGAKIGGVLIETQSRPDGSLWVVLGFGINVAVVPDNIDRPATSLAKLGFEADPIQVLDELDAELRTNMLNCRSEDDGWSQTLESWMDYAPEIGTPITVHRRANEHIAGTFAGLDEHGALRLSANGVIETITFGDVDFDLG